MNFIINGIQSMLTKVVEGSGIDLNRLNQPFSQQAGVQTTPHLHRTYTRVLRGHSHPNGNTVYVADFPPPEGYAPDPFYGKNGVASGKEAKVWGDPHVEEADGGRFDFQGKAGRIYNLLNDSGIRVNARFQAYGGDGATTIGEMGVLVCGPEGSDLIRINPHEFSPVSVNGRVILPGQTIRLTDGGSLTCSSDGRTITFSTREGYQNTVTVQGNGPSAYLDYSVRSGSHGVATDGRMPGGIVGHTFDGNGSQRNGRTGSGAQGEGAIDGVYTDYEVEGLFGSPQIIYTADEIHRLWVMVSEETTSQALYRIGEETQLSQNDKSKRRERILELALSSGNIELAVILMTSLQAKEANQVLRGLMEKMRDLQEQRRQIADQIGGIKGDGAEDARKVSQLNLRATDLGTEIGILQTFIQDVMSQKAESQAMASNILKSRHDTAMGIVRNMA